MSPEEALKTINNGRPVTFMLSYRFGLKRDGSSTYVTDLPDPGVWNLFTSTPEDAIALLTIRGFTFSMTHTGDWWHEAKEVETLQTIKAAPKVAGYSCKKCNEFCEFSEPNQADGSFICFKCR